MHSLIQNLAYRYVIAAILLYQVNLFCSRLSILPSSHITESDIRQGSHIGLPQDENISGSIFTDQYFFGIANGRVVNFYQRQFQPQTDAEAKRQDLMLARHSSLINSNQAYQLATNWLDTSGVNVASLDSKFRPRISQWKYYPHFEPTNSLTNAADNAILLPVFQIEWWGPWIRHGRKISDMPIVKIVVSGITKGMIEYHVYDDSLFLNGGSRIKNLDGLLSVADTNFMKYDESQRRTLINRYSNIAEAIANDSDAGEIKK